MTDVDRLREWMRKTGWNQRSLASMMGVDESLISHILHGRRDISGKFMWDFSQVFGLEASKIFSSNIEEEHDGNGTP